MELNPITLASTDDLIEALKTRFDKVLIVGLQERPGADHFFIDYRGLTTCIGLAERAKARMIEVSLSPSDEDLPEVEE